MAALSNARHERFAQELVKGNSEVRAYIEAGYSPSSANQNAHRLSENEGVKARVRELQERGAQRTDMTLERITQMLLEDREFAREHKQAGPAGQCTERLAKLHGVYTERIDTYQYIVTNDPMSPDDWAQTYAGDVTH